MVDIDPDNTGSDRCLHKPSATAAAHRLPVVIEARGDDRDLLAWLAPRRGEVERELLARGAILLRGFTMRQQIDLETFAMMTGGPLMDYQDRATPRQRVAGRVLTSTDAPRRYHIPMHNENSFASTWPLRIVFHCVKPAEGGGCTPLADSRRVYQRLAPEVRQRFAQRGVLYVRNFGNGPGMGWRDAFQVQTHEQLEHHCHAAGIEYTWLSDDRLRTRQRCRADAIHPRTGEAVWFCHATALHVTALAPTLRDTLLRQFGEDNLPHHAYYGDGAPIEPATLEHIRDAYEAETVRFDWQAGDTLLLDSMLVAHGRDRYEGERQVVAVLSAPTSWRDIAASGSHGDGAAAPMPPTAPEASPPQPAAAAARHANGEALLLATVAEVLEVVGVDMEDNFFELGGDSLTATRVITILRDRAGIELPLAAFFNVSTVRELVELVRKAGR